MIGPKKDEPDNEFIFEGFTEDEINKNFSKLAEELFDEDITIDSLLEKEDLKSEDTVKIPYFRNYQPNIYDFLARAKTEEQCFEIIDYCLKKGEISIDEANEIKHKINSGVKGIYGTRNPGYYSSKL
ncbi:MAG: DUF2095 domain-containing protein [Candidatus Heimdallarchaeota archaeon]|nr:DUF2095 domain-containing protein [Candidatus Heimdallarchaeota archaeon]MDH5645481.1 DUF2095 domain-containing protein [Candidatus Heimdallarchaeota archaeon]